MTLPVERFAEVEEYIALLTGSVDTPMTWRLFGDHSALPAKVFKATLEDAEQELVEANERGYGVYANVNETNGGGKKADVTRIRAVYAEFDGGKYTEPPLEPTFVVDSKNGKHLYWVLTDEITVDQAEDLLRRIIHLLGSDPKIKDASRVLRVPGFVHMKDPDEPYEVSLSAPDLPKNWSYSQLIDAFPEVRQESIKLSSIVDNPSTVSGKCRGDVTDTSYGLAAAAKEFDKICAIQRGNGETNEAVYMAAFKLATLFHSDLTEATALEYIQRACERIGYTPANGEHDVPGTIESGFRAGRENPRADRVAPEPVVAQSVNWDEIEFDACMRWGAEESKRRKALGYQMMPSPICGLNTLLGGGAMMGGTTLLCAPPGSGKTSFALEWAMHVARKGWPSMYISIEMPRDSVLARIVSMEFDENWGKIRLGGYEGKYIELSERPGRPKLMAIADRRQIPNTDTMSRAIDYRAEKYGKPPFVVVDYVQAMSEGGGEDQKYEMGRISNGLRDVAVNTGSALLCVSSVSRGAYDMIDKRNNKPNMGVVLRSAKETGTLEFDAEAVVGVCKTDAKDDSGNGFMWLCVAKNRSGGSEGMVPVRFYGRKGKFEECSEDELFQSLKADKDLATRISVRAKLIEAFCTFRHFRSRSELVEAAQVGKQMGLQEAQRMMDNGEIKQTPVGTLVLTEDLS